MAEYKVKLTINHNSTLQRMITTKNILYLYWCLILLNLFTKRWQFWEINWQNMDNPHKLLWVWLSVTICRNLNVAHYLALIVLWPMFLNGVFLGPPFLSSTSRLNDHSEKASSTSNTEYKFSISRTKCLSIFPIIPNVKRDLETYFTPV